MNKQGRQSRNNEAVWGLVSNKVDLGEGFYGLVDNYGVGLMARQVLVDTVDGRTYIGLGNETTECNTGDKSRKSNGYVYTPIYILENEVVKKIDYGTHSLVGMVAHGDQYEAMIREGLTPVANHKDNCHWNNKADNLEWVTQSLNNLHGKMVHSIAKVDPSRIEIKKNKSNKGFITLREPISAYDIINYVYEVSGSQNWREHFGLEDNDSLIDKIETLIFLDWLDSRKSSKVVK